MHRKRMIGALVAVLLWASAGKAQTPPTDSSALSTLDDVVKKAISEWKIPGLSIAVVKNGQVIYSKGFGYRDVDKKLPVTTDTLFAIGSISKSFTSLIFGTLNDEGKVDWDKPIRTYLPTFQVDDPIATDHASARDLLSHRTGLAGHDLVWYSSNFSREDLFHRLKYLKSNKEFRQGYEYCNLMVMTAGYLEGQVAGTSWEELVRTRIFQPLEMHSSNFSVTDSQKSADFSQPYSLKDETVIRVPFKNIDSIGPAGSINSSINDMSHYLVFQLGDGTYHGKKIVSQANLKLVHTGQTPITGFPEFFTQNGLGPMTYAMGWVDTTFRGHRMVWHNGGIDGFHSLLTMLPDEQIGVVILSNMAGNSALEPIVYSAFDGLLGLTSQPWVDRYKAEGEKMKKAAEAAKTKEHVSAKAGTQASHPLADFAGDYVNPAYGTIKIVQQGNDLTIALNQMPSAPFIRVHYDIFEVPEKSDSEAAGTRGQFYMNRDGDLDRLAMPLAPTLPEDIVFTRVTERKK
jgi:CubicO group peptidase (beta-lactamase class C family)